MATAVAGVIAATVGGWTAMTSAVLGGLCVALPNAVFALRMVAGMMKPGGASAATWFIGEFVKIALTLALMGAVAWWYPGVNWFAFVAGIIVALKSYIILLFRQ